MSFGENLKNIRKQRGITQEELAEILGVSRQAVSKWESDGGYPETEKLIAISKQLNISIDYLLNDASVMEKKEEVEEKSVVYATLEDVKKEISEITNAIQIGENTYKLKYNADVEDRIVGSPKLKK